MTAITAPRDCKPRLGSEYNVGVKAGEVIVKGAALLIDSSGFLVNAASGAAGASAGVAQESRNAAGLASGAIHCKVRTGLFPFLISGASPVTTGDRDALVYFADNQTIAKSSNSGARPAAGYLRLVTADNRAIVDVGGAPDLVAASGAVASAATALAAANAAQASADAHVLRHMPGGADTVANGTFAFASSVSIDVSTKYDHALTSTVTGAMALTLTGGVNGNQGTIAFVQDGAGHSVTIAASGRTVRSSAAISSAANAIVSVGYEFKTVNAIAYLFVYPSAMS